MLDYKGYSGRVEYDQEGKLFHGEVLDLKDIVTFQGTTVDEIEEAFRESVDDYLDFCRERGEEADKPFSGRLMLRLAPNLHRQVYVHARKEGKSLNQWISEKLAIAAPPREPSQGAS
ncbi:type II toxin-antitoxin system HicB family antitoxin [soil metagenome]